ncbi:redoxin domain-containing protein [Solitalea sp. MAHUQ-68]|uniref:Redoxin domain-containing protein n=1 Tax=Solitalea agri TaxID=2953739 RepID=A0A9X2F0J2_9SPHI|nr:redoxin domain-containing protein [Solitalea agri]MCO4292457.1 redoxin domain-containing protein [Solitalea agri]
MSLTIGSKAPEFKLFNTEKAEVSLSDFKGKKVIIHFFPFAFTSVCTTQLCTMRDNFGYYEGMNAQVLGISIDTPFTLAKYKEENNYQFPLLSDFNKEVSKAFGAQYEIFAMGLKGVAKRAAFVIDEEGFVKYAEVLENAGELPNFSAINEALK